MGATLWIRCLKGSLNLLAIQRKNSASSVRTFSLGREIISFRKRTSFMSTAAVRILGVNCFAGGTFFIARSACEAETSNGCVLLAGKRGEGRTVLVRASDFGPLDVLLRHVACIAFVLQIHVSVPRATGTGFGLPYAASRAKTLFCGTRLAPMYQPVHSVASSASSLHSFAPLIVRLKDETRQKKGGRE